MFIIILSKFLHQPSNGASLLSGRTSVSVSHFLDSSIGASDKESSTMGFDVSFIDFPVILG
jgi:hypothetical protein